MNRGATLLVALLVAVSTVTMAAGAATTTGAESNTTIESDATLDGAELETGASTETSTSTSSGTDSGATATGDGTAYAGANVAFDVRGDAIANYSVGGEQTFSTVAVQSKSEVDGNGGAELEVGTGLEAATNLNGAGLSLESQAQASATIQSDSGATLSAHDNRHGTLVVESGDQAQYVEADLGASAEAREDGDRVVVETDSREGAFLVVGDGNVSVTDGNVTAELGENATLAFRSYEDGERDERAQYEESLIANGSAALEVTADSRDGETVTDAVTYGQETSAEVATTAEGQVEMTIDRATHEGTIVVTTVSEEAVGSLENVSVTVDGEAAVEASSKSELEGAIGSDESRYMVVQDTQAQGQATVYVAVNHFSERTATIDGSSTQDDGTDGSGDETSTGESTDESGDGSGDSMPGFGVSVATVAISLAGLLARLQD